ncbi:MAG: efflux RND transporter periplasmic adaptor subunit [Bacteroidales bacterium]|nr:efflux RND transporter periplasmic adaptor subunit [Bacteroidales bacterium]
MKKFKVQSLAAIAGISATVLTLASCGSKESQQMPDMTPEIATVTVQPGTADLTTSLAANIQGKTDIAVRPLVSGFVTKVHVDEGAYVHRGQPLFTLDQVQYQAAVDQATAAVNSARTALETARLTASNKQTLFDKNIISEYENQLAKNSLAQAQAALAQAEAGLTSAKKNLSYTVVTAPSDGYVGSITNREGSLASPSMVTPLTTVSDNSDVYAYFSLNEKDILDITDGGKLTLSEAIAKMPPVQLQLADGTIYPETGEVATVSGVLDLSTGSASARARFKNLNGMLRSGSTAQILIPHHMEGVITIPQKAAFEVQDRKFVYTVNDSSKTVTTPVTVSPQSDGKNYIVTSGLTPGQRVVVEGVGTKVRPDMPIKAVDAAELAARAAAQQQGAQQAQQ